MSVKSEFFKLLLVLRSSDRFGWYDVHYDKAYQGTVKAYSAVHALDLVAKHDAYTRDAKGLAIGSNRYWKASFNSAPMAPCGRDDVKGFRLSRSHIKAPS